jgi:hypothetical protein
MTKLKLCSSLRRDYAIQSEFAGTAEHGRPVALQVSLACNSGDLALSRDRQKGGENRGGGPSERVVGCSDLILPFDDRQDTL